MNVLPRFDWTPIVAATHRTTRADFVVMRHAAMCRFHKIGVLIRVDVFGHYFFLDFFFFMGFLSTLSRPAVSASSF